MHNWLKTQQSLRANVAFGCNQHKRKPFTCFKTKKCIAHRRAERKKYNKEENCSYFENVTVLVLCCFTFLFSFLFLCHDLCESDLKYKNTHVYTSVHMYILHILCLMRFGVVQKRRFLSDIVFKQGIYLHTTTSEPRHRYRFRMLRVSACVRS